MHEGVIARLCCAFIHRVAFEEVSGHRVLIKSGLGNRGLLACGTTRELRLEFPRETSLILKCLVKVGNPLHTKQGKRPSYREQEGRRGSDKLVPGTSVFTSSETDISGNFWGSHQGCQVSF